MNIFIIDDELDVAQTLSEGLSLRLDCKCLIFESLDRCLEDIDNKLVPDFILSDVHMPTGSGLRIMDELKSRKLDIPVIFITGMMDKLPKENNVTMIRKPVSLDLLIELINQTKN